MKVKLLIAVIVVSIIAGCDQNTNHQIPYPDALDKAAVVQNDITDIDGSGIPIGNGDLNALVYSSEDSIMLWVLKNDVWDSRMETSEDPPLPTVNVKDHTYTDARGAPPSWTNHKYPNQIPFCRVIIEAGKNIDTAKLDLRKALAEIRGEQGQTKIRTLWQDNVFLVETEGEVSIAGIEWDFLPDVEKGEADGVTWIKQTFPADIDYGGMQVLAAMIKDGKNTAIAVVSSWESENLLNDATLLAKEIMADTKKSIDCHKDNWEEFWATSGIKLDEPDFQNWWYRQLYYFRCFTREGSVAIGLGAGSSKLPGWHGSYKINYNSWQTYWTPFAYNHPRLGRPWIEHLYNYLPRARWFAKECYGCEGAAFFSDTWPHEVDPAECKSRNKHQISYMPWGYTMGMSGMAIQNAWNSFLYEPDTTYLQERIYPLIKEVAIFYSSFIEQCAQDENGKVILGPSYNPEHGPFGTDDNPYDLAYTKYTLDAAIEAAKILNIDEDLVSRFSSVRTLLPDYHTTPDPEQDGKLIVANWRNAKHDAIKTYNITTPVISLFPGDYVTWFSPKEEKELFKRTIHHVEDKYNRNNSVVILNTARARLSMTEDALRDTKEWFREKEYPNGLFFWLGHGQYLSEQTAVGTLICEFLMQSVGGIIRIFPAWKKDKDASFSNLRAQGGFLVSSSLKNGEIVSLQIKSTAGGKLKLLNPFDAKIRIVIGKKEVPFELSEDNIITLDTEQGEIYSIRKLY